MRKSAIFFTAALISLVASSAQSMDRPPGNWNEYAKAAKESFSIGDFVTAESNYRSSLDASPPKSAIPGLQVQYTNALLSQGDFQLAAKELKKTLSVAKSISGTDSADYAEALDLQAWMFQINGKLNDAMASLKDSISLLTVKSPGTSDLADAYEHMGMLAEMLGLFDQASQNYTKALEIRKILSGPASVEVADNLEALGQIALRRGQNSNAPQYFANALRIKESRGEPWKPYAPEPTERVVVFHFIPGAPNCAQTTLEGVLIERMAANGLVIEAGISQKPSDFAKTTRALVRIKNNSQYDVDILPRQATFIQITPDVQILKPINATELASQIEKKGESKAKWIKFWGANATSSLTSYGYQSGRGMPPVYGGGYLPPSFGWQGGGYGAGGYGGYGYNNYNQGRRNNWSQTSTMITQVPDYQKREEAYRKAAETTTQSKTEATAIRDAALGPNRLRAGAYIEGALDFDLSKYKTATLRIPVGNAIYEFRFQ